MSLFNMLGNNQPAAGTQRQAIDRLKSDPVGELGRAGLRIPAGMSDPREIVGHLLQTGQVGGAKAQMIQAMQRQLGLK